MQVIPLKFNSSFYTTRSNISIFVEKQKKNLNRSIH